MPADSESFGVANVLIAIFSEKQSHAVHLLNRAEVTRLDVVNFVSHGLSKIAEEKTGKEEAGAEPERGDDAGSALDKYTTNLNQQAQEGKIDPLIGRTLEVERTIEIQHAGALGPIEGLGGDVQAVVADEADQAVAQVFARQQHEDDEDDHQARGRERPEEPAEVFAGHLQSRGGLGVEAHR